MKSVIVSIGLLTGTIAYGVTNLSVGDLTVLGMNGVAQAEQSFSFVTWKELSAGTTVNMTDKGVSSVGNWGNPANTGESGVFTWEATETIAAGTVITISFNTLNSTVNTSVGAITGNGSEVNFGVEGDQIFLFQGSDASPEFIFGLNTGNLYQTDLDGHPFEWPQADIGWFGYTTIGGTVSAVPTILQNTENSFGNFSWFYYNSFVFNEMIPQNGQYVGPREGLTIEEYKAEINNLENWSLIFANLPEGLNGDNFAFAPVPEPSQVALITALLALCAIRYKQRK